MDWSVEPWAPLLHTCKKSLPAYVLPDGFRSKKDLCCQDKLPILWDIHLELMFFWNEKMAPDAFGLNLR